MAGNFVNYSNMTALMTKIANKIKNAGHNFNDDDFVVENNEVSLIPAQRIFTGTQAEWDALTLAEKQTYGQANITDDESGTPEYYSTEEVKTNKVWIDGKPIYRVVRHVWDVGNVPATGYSFSGTMLSGPLTNDAESLIKVVVLCKNTQGCWQELTGNGENGPAQNFVWYSDTSAYFIHSGTLNGAWAIFEYTKTTD